MYKDGVHAGKCRLTGDEYKDGMKHMSMHGMDGIATGECYACFKIKKRIKEIEVTDGPKKFQLWNGALRKIKEYIKEEFG